MQIQHLFPAHAGVIPCAAETCARSSAFPRPRGGDPGTGTELYNRANFSPPTRGFHIDNPAQKADNRFILNAERGKVYAVF